MSADITATVFVAADPPDVFDYFTRPELLETWMGEGAVLDTRPGGAFALEVNGTAVRGTYLEVDPPHRLVISWGFVGSADLPPGASTVEVRLAPDRDGTMVTITHRLLPEDQREAHGRGWRRYLGGLAAAAAPSRRTR